MKTTIFVPQHMRPNWTELGLLAGFHIPTLDAYAIEFAELTPPASIDYGHQKLLSDSGFHIQGSTLTLVNPVSNNLFGIFPDFHGHCLTVHYHGLRDYRLLFPQVSEESLRSRLADFYAEAEEVFEVGAWLSFSLMATAIYEGLLAWELSKPKDQLVDLISNAKSKELVDESTAEILTAARETRNLVHASKHQTSFITRAHAMDMRKVLDSLIRRFSASQKNRQE